MWHGVEPQGVVMLPVYGQLGERQWAEVRLHSNGLGMEITVKWVGYGDDRSEYYT
jgi:hypothetical protein